MAMDDNNANGDITQPVEQEMEAKYGQRTNRYALRPRRSSGYNQLQHATLASTVMTQHSMKKGITIFGEAGIEAVQQELKQLHDCKVLKPRSATDLSSSKKWQLCNTSCSSSRNELEKLKAKGVPMAASSMSTQIWKMQALPTWQLNLCCYYAPHQGAR
jgi:hypothetical protein